MCVVAKVATAFELGKLNRNNVHDNIQCYVIRMKNRSVTALSLMEIDDSSHGIHIADIASVKCLKKVSSGPSRMKDGEV